MTFSIAARDATTGELGVAVQSAMFGVGAVVPWARSGVGAVATQGQAESAYGPRCLDALAAGCSAAEALDRASAADPLAALRQVAVVAADGAAAATTGELCIAHAGHLTGDGFSVQANMAADAAVWPAMAEAFTAGSDRSLARRLLAALHAAQDAGGDARGMMSAAVLVVSGEPGPEGSGTVVDLRVDRDPDPIAALDRLVEAADGYALFHRAVAEMYGGDPGAALRDVEAGLQLLPGEPNHRFLRAGALLAGGEVAGAQAELRSLIAECPGWEVIVRGFADKGLVAVPAGLTVDSLLA